jgi:hypothetical protein
MVLSREFVRKAACMDELELFLKRVEGGERLHIMPVFYGIDYDYCFNKLPGAYDTEEWVTTEAKPGPEELKRWGGLVKRLTEFTGKRKDQVGPLRLSPHCQWAAQQRVLLWRSGSSHIGDGWLAAGLLLAC